MVQRGGQGARVGGIAKGRKRNSGFVAARKQIRRGRGWRTRLRAKRTRGREAEGKEGATERRSEGGGERRQGVAGNKRLANPSCQFNLASNPGEMLIRASLPFLPSPPLPSSPSRPPVSSLSFPFRGLRVAHARTRAREPATTLYFRAKIPPARRRPRGNCVQSELHPSFLFLDRSGSLLYSPSRSRRTLSHPPLRLVRRPLSAFHPRNLSRLCRRLAVESVPADKGTPGGKILPPLGPGVLSQCYRLDSITRSLATGAGNARPTTTRLMR